MKPRLMTKANLLHGTCRDDLPCTAALLLLPDALRNKLTRMATLAKIKPDTSNRTYFNFLQTQNKHSFKRFFNKLLILTTKSE